MIRINHCSILYRLIKRIINGMMSLTSCPNMYVDEVGNITDVSIIIKYYVLFKLPFLYSITSILELENFTVTWQRRSIATRYYSFPLNITFKTFF